MGLLRTLFKIKAYVALVGAGYLLHSCVSSDQRYRIKRDDNQAYLIDTVKQRSLEIHADSFQVGSIEHRVLGLLREKNLEASLHQLEKTLEEYQ